MKLLSAKRYGVKLKATIQATGRLGFPKATSDLLNFSKKGYVKFFLDDEDGLYLVLLDHVDDDAFKMLCSSGYYSIGTTALFDELRYDYKKGSIIFTLVRDASLDDQCAGEVYKMIKRELKEKQKNEKANI